ncbi:hypothetical protein ACTXT7_004692 [Hymenolepis weldensis]
MLPLHLSLTLSNVHHDRRNSLRSTFGTVVCCRWLRSGSGPLVPTLQLTALKIRNLGSGMSGLVAMK